MIIPAFAVNCLCASIPVEYDLSTSSLFAFMTCTPPAVTDPKVVNGIATGNGDGYTNLSFNNAINSWYGTGFVDTWSKACRATIDHRTGNFITFGFVSAGNSMYTPVIVGTNGLEYNTTTSNGIHNFKIDGVQKVYINNTDLTNLVAFNQVNNATFHGNINVTGTVTADAFIGTSSNGAGAILNSNSFSSLSYPINAIYRLQSIVLTPGTWIVTSQVQLNTGEASNVRRCC